MTFLPRLVLIHGITVKDFFGTDITLGGGAFVLGIGAGARGGISYPFD
jgi:hypothetical protein